MFIQFAAESQRGTNLRLMEVIVWTILMQHLVCMANLILTLSAAGYENPEKSLLSGTTV